MLSYSSQVPLYEEIEAALAKRNNQRIEKRQQSISNIDLNNQALKNFTDMK